MSYVFNACTDPVAEMGGEFTIAKVTAVEEDGDKGDSKDGPIGE